MNLSTILSQTQPTVPAVWFVCVLGVGVVFLGLVLLIGIVSLTNWITSKFIKEETAKQANTPAPITTASSKIENKQEIIAAVCAAVAEENGTDISAIRVLSFKKIN